MKILLINHYAGAHKYGMEFRPLYLAREWTKVNNEVVIVASDQSHIRANNPDFKSKEMKPLQGLDSQKFRTEKIDDIQYIWCKTPEYSGNGMGRVFNIFVFLIRLFQLSFWLGRNFLADVIITSSTYPMDIFPARWMKFVFSKFGRRTKPTKLVYEVHDLWPLSPIELGGMSPWHPFILWIQGAEDLSYRWADQVISMLPKTKEYMISRGMRPNKFSYVPNGIDFAEWDSDSKSLLNLNFQKQAAEIKSGFTLTVAYFGTHGLANALVSFVEAAELALEKKLSIAFILVGTGPDKSTLVQLAKSKKLTNIFFLEAISKSEIPNALQLFDILYIGLQKQKLFRFGISPNKLIDYMAAAKPILFAIEAGNDPVLENSCGLSIMPEDPVAIVEALVKFSTLAVSERKNMGMRGRAFARENHDYRVLAGKFLKIIGA